jgi:hypothetical protein
MCLVDTAIDGMGYMELPMVPYAISSMAGGWADRNRMVDFGDLVIVPGPAGWAGFHANRHTLAID